MHIHTQQISVLPSAETVAAAEGWLRISVAWPSSTELQVRKQKLQKESVVEVRCPPLFNKRPRFQTLTVWRAKTQTGPRRDRNTGTHTQWHNLTHTHIRGTVLCGCKVEQCWLSALSESTLKTQRLETDSGRAVNYTQTRTHSASNTNLLEKWMWCSLSFTSLKKQKQMNVAITCNESVMLADPEVVFKEWNWVFPWTLPASSASVFQTDFRQLPRMTPDFLQDWLQSLTFTMWSFRITFPPSIFAAVRLSHPGLVYRRKKNSSIVSGNQDR